VQKLRIKVKKEEEKQSIKQLSHKMPLVRRRELSITDVMPLPAVSELRNKALGLDAYMTVGKINPSGVIECVTEEPRMSMIDLFQYM
jgi:hypothetical protein